MIRYRVRHVTTYRYKSPVALGEHRIMLRPRESADQRTVSLALDIDPKPEALRWAEDPSGNGVAFATFGRRARELVFASDVLVDQVPFAAAGPHLPGFARTGPFSYDAEEMPDLARFIERQHSDPDRVLDGWLRDLVAEDAGQDTWSFLLRLNGRIRSDFAYLRREEKGIQSPAQTLRTRKGSCRDFALLMIEALRSRGLAGRFVSGYLRVRSSEPRTALIGGSTHAWLQVYLPRVGWVDFDPTSGEHGNLDRIRVAAVRDAEGATPISGSFMGFPSDFTGMTVHVDVTLVGSGASRANEHDTEPTGIHLVASRA